MRRTLKFALLAVAFAVTPFCWSVGRDLAPLVFASDETTRVEAGIALELFAKHRRIHLGEQPPLATMSLPQNCFSVEPDAVRPNFRFLNKNIDGVDEQSRSRGWIVGMSAYGIAYAHFAEARGVEALQRNLSAFDLAALNGCMTATPFSKWCDKRVEAKMGFDFRLVEQDLVARGLARHAATDDGSEILCTTVPEIDDDGPR